MAYIREDFTTVINADGSYTVTAATAGDYTAYWSKSPDGFSDDNELGRFSDTLTAAVPLRAPRIYIHILSADGRYSVTATRSQIAGGQQNLRDLGGYNTADGSHFVKWGRYWRSDMLSLAGEAGMPVLKSLGLKHIIDLRSTCDLLPGMADPDVPGAKHEFLSVYAEDCEMITLEEASNTGEDAMRLGYSQTFGSYALMPFGTVAYPTLFNYILEGEVPLLFHCFAGKDRTGVGAALLLSALGVPRETVFYDYMLTCETRRAFYEDRLAQHPDLYKSEEMRHILWLYTLVHKESLELAFSTIEERYGDMDTYFEAELGYGADKLARLRSVCLTPHKL